jgi:predicted nucleic-acid-binding protein
MLAIDTNILVRILARDDLKQAQIADKLTAKGAWVSHLVLVETCWVLDAVYTRTSAQLIAMLELLLTHETIVLQDADTVALALDSFRLKPALGFSDCLILAVAQKSGHTPLGTFDKQLSKLAGVQLFKGLSA